MQVALIGATGFVGTALLQELLDRGHAVTAIVRDASRLPAHARLKAVPADVMDAAALSQAIEGQEAVVSAFNPGWTDPDLHDRFLRGSDAIVEATRRARVPRLLVVGGAGSLYVAPGVQLVDTPQFRDHVPANVVPGALAAREALKRLRAESAIDWTFVSPPAMLKSGQRTGRYRLGGDDLLMDGEAPAGISVQDLAVAIVDELEKPQHRRRRFTAAN